MKAAIGVLIFIVAAGAVSFALSPQLRARVLGTESAPQPSAQEQGSSQATTTPQAPAQFDSATLRTRINQGSSGLDITLIPLEVTEDSRCPTEVQCVWAGTLKVRTTLRSASGESVETFELGKTITTETRAITLVEVLPVKRTTDAIAVGDYLFVFEVKKRIDL